jgi:hypothetical protein
VVQTSDAQTPEQELLPQAAEKSATEAGYRATSVCAFLSQLVDFG